MFKAIGNVLRKALGWQPRFTTWASNPWRWMFGGAQTIEGYDNKIVYAGLNLLVRKLNECSVIVSKTSKKTGKVTKYYNLMTSEVDRVAALIKGESGISSYVKKELQIDELSEHPLIELLERPNDYQTGLELWEQFWYNFQYGDGYIIALNDPDGPGAESRTFRPTKFFAPNKNMVYPQKSTSAEFPISSYRITLFNGSQVDLDPRQVFHLSKWNPQPESIYGWVFTQSAGQTIGRNNENQVAQGAAFRNGGRGVLFTGESEISSMTGKVVDKLSGKQMSLLKETMMRNIQGSENNRQMSWTNGPVKVQNYGDTLAEMQLIDAESADWRDIYTVLGIPQVLGPTVDAMTENNVKAGYKALVSNTCIPDLKKRDLKFSRWIQQWYGADIIVTADLTEYTELAPDLELMMKVFGKPLLENDERRAIYKYDNMKDAEQGRTVLVEGNQKTLTQVMDGSYDPQLVPPDGKDYR